MTDLRKAAEMALEALEDAASRDEMLNWYGTQIAALREALAQPEQEPVAWILTSGDDVALRKYKPSEQELEHLSEMEVSVSPLYLHPAPAVVKQEPVAWVFDDWPEYHAVAMGCGLEDRCITDRYEAMRYGWDEAIERMAERLNDYTHPAPIPKGWQLVPIEPTEEMVDKGAQGMASFQEDSVWPNSWDAIQVKGMRHDAKKAYRYMLAAAPKPEDV